MLDGTLGEVDTGIGLECLEFHDAPGFALDKLPTIWENSVCVCVCLVIRQHVRTILFI
jgi:hypothetical protein